MSLGTFKIKQCPNARASKFIYFPFNITGKKQILCSSLSCDVSQRDSTAISEATSTRTLRALHAQSHCSQEGSELELQGWGGGRGGKAVTVHIPITALLPQTALFKLLILE